MLTKQRMEELTVFGLDLAVRGVDVPLGSLAHAIANRLNCSITLWPWKSLKGKQDGERAILYKDVSAIGDAETPGLVQYHVFYAPSDGGGPGSMDLVTRYTVAHELAHIALRHPMQNRVKDRRRELEAHYLAILLLAVHGAPRERVPLAPERAAAILDQINVSAAERTFLLDAVWGHLKLAPNQTPVREYPYLVGRLSGGAVPPPINDGAGAEIRTLVEQEVQRFTHEQAHREKVAEAALSALEVATGVREPF